MLGIRSIATVVSAAAVVIALSSTAAFGQRREFASTYDAPYVAHYDAPYYAHGDYLDGDHDFGFYVPHYRPFDDAPGYVYPSHRAKFANWFVPETYEPASRQDSYVGLPRSWDSLDFQLGTRCDCSNAGYLVPNPLLPRHDAPPIVRTFESRPPVPADLPPTLNQERVFPEPAPSIPDGLRELTPRDRQAALTQRTCPVTGDVLGMDGTPLKVRVGGRDVFVCCEGCVADLQTNPNKYLPALDTRIERQSVSPSPDGNAGKHDHGSHTHDH